MFLDFLPAVANLSPDLTVLISTAALVLLVVFRARFQQDAGGKKSKDVVRSAAEQAVENLPCDAKTSWARGFGRLKYCGLRPNPAEPAEKPQYLLEAPDLGFKLKETGPEADPAKLADFARRIADVKSTWPRSDPATLQRYLRARKGNVRDAEKQWREAVKWIRGQQAERALLEWNIEAYEQCFAPWWLSGGFLGHGRKGEPVAFERLGHCDFAGLCNRLSFTEMQRLDVVHIMRTVAAIEEDALQRGRAIMGDCTVVIDVKGFGWDQAQFQAMRKLAKIIQGRNLTFAEFTGRVLLVRAPPFFVNVWGKFCILLDKATQEKVQLATEGKSMDLMLKYMDEDTIPAFLGGKKCVDGDPECRTVLAPGGPIPEEALQRFHALKNGESGPFALEAPSSPGSFALDGRESDRRDTCACGVCPRRA